LKKRQQVKEILQSALERSPDKREQFLDNACAEDDSLLHDAETLLSSSENVGSFTEQAAIGKAAETLVGAEKNSPSGERLNHYKILSRIGAGGMGEVFLAEDTKLHRRVALKLLPQSLSFDKDANRRLLREARAAAALDHPHICQIHEISEADGRFFIVMQFCEGETLAEKLERRNLNLPKTLDLAIQIADALANAHLHQVIHRDIKPANIIVNNRGQAKILDFGLAKIFGENRDGEGEAEAAQLLSAANMIMGTAPYMSPEQARGKPLDARTDIFSFGALLYEMLSGKQVFRRASFADTVSAVLNFEPPIAETIPDAPPELRRIVLKSLAKDKEERYQTAEDLLLDLRGLQKRLEFEAELLRDSETGRRGEGKNVTEIQPSPVLPVSSSPRLNSIAVLPFANLSSDAENEYFCDGLAEELLNALAKIDDLKVAARTSAFSFKGKNTNVGEIGKILNVKTVLEGSVRKSGNKLRILVQLINIADGYHLWSEKYDREMKDIFDVQDEITLAVVDALKVKLLGGKKSAVLKRYTDNAEAYELYLKGLYFFNKHTEEGWRKAIEYFEKTIEIEPEHAPAYAGIGFCYATFWFYYIAPPEITIPKWKSTVSRALEIDDDLPEAHNTMAGFRYLYEWNWTEAEREFRRAIENKPNSADAHWRFGVFLAVRERFDEAIVHARRAIELDPLSLSVNLYAGYIYRFADRQEEAFAQCQKLIEIEPRFYGAYWLQAAISKTRGEYEEAIEAYRKALALGGNQTVLSILGDTYALAGKTDEASEILNQLLEMSKTQYVAAFNIARIYWGLGENDTAFEWLEKALEERNGELLFLHLEAKTGKENIFGKTFLRDSRFTDLLRRIGLQP
jgi:serine/threonine-protein kinase